MRRRAIKKRFKKAFIIIVYGSILTFLLSLVFLALKFSTSLLDKTNIGKDQEIIKPIVGLTNKNNLLDLLNKVNLEVDSINDSTRSSVIIAKIKDGPEVYFSKTKDILWQVSSLKLILSKFTIDNRKPISVDLGSERPIVKF